MITTVVTAIMLVVQVASDAIIALPVRKAEPVSDEVGVTTTLRIRRFIVVKEDGPSTTAIDMQAIPTPVRKKPSQPKKKPVASTTKSVRRIATIYSASSFHCPACKNLESFVRSKGATGRVRFDYSEPSWVKAYPTVRYYDGSGADHGEHLRDLLSR